VQAHARAHLAAAAHEMQGRIADLRGFAAKRGFVDAVDR
jgi:hypothetical protein